MELPKEELKKPTPKKQSKNPKKRPPPLKMNSTRPPRNRKLKNNLKG
jgi:hypothetical protein